jgi:hypothetical protein
MQLTYCAYPALTGRLRLKCDGTSAKTRFRLLTKRTSPFKSAGSSVQSTTDRRAVHISLQGLYCSCKPVFCSHVTLTGYPLHSLASPSLPLPCVTVCNHISTGLYLGWWTQENVRSRLYCLCSYHRHIEHLVLDLSRSSKCLIKYFAQHITVVRRILHV